MREVVAGPENETRELKEAYQNWEQKESSGLQKILLFVISIAVFFSSGLIQSSSADVLILVFVILIHEAGHFLGMKLFRYTDVKMFFVPFMGAAVSGKARNEISYKKIIISLLGPLPGIAIGIACFVLFYATRDQLMIKMATTFMLINVFNLLPIMPLDGGRVVSDLFTKNPVVTAIFNVLSLAMLVVLAFTLKSFALGILAFFMAISTIAIYKAIRTSNKIIAANGGRPIPRESILANDGSAYFEDILGETKKAFHKNFEKDERNAFFQNLDDVIRLVSTRHLNLWQRLFSFFSFSLILLFSLIFGLIILASDFQVERNKDDLAGGSISVKMYGKVVEEHQIDAYGYYNGASAYLEDADDATNARYTNTLGSFTNGRRWGAWQTLGTGGKLEYVRFYSNGFLLRDEDFTTNKYYSRTNWISKSIEFYRSRLERQKAYL